MEVSQDQWYGLESKETTRFGRSISGDYLSEEATGIDESNWFGKAGWGKQTKEHCQDKDIMSRRRKVGD